MVYAFFVVLGMLVGLTIAFTQHHRKQQQYIAQLRENLSEANLDRENLIETNHELIAELQDKDSDLYKLRDNIDELLEENRELRCRSNPKNTYDNGLGLVKSTLSCCIEHLRGLTKN